MMRPGDLGPEIDEGKYKWRERGGHGEHGPVSHLCMDALTAPIDVPPVDRLQSSVLRSMRKCHVVDI